MPRWFVIVFLTLGGLAVEAQTSGPPASGMGQRVTAEAARGYEPSPGATCRRRTGGRVTAVRPQGVAPSARARSSTRARPATSAASVRTATRPVPSARGAALVLRGDRPTGS